MAPDNMDNHNNHNRRKRVRVFKLTLDMKKKLFVVFAVAIGLLVFLLVRIAFIQVTNGEAYARTVLDQQSYTETTIPYRRGDIKDCKGTVLATSTDVYNMILDSSVLTSDEDYMDPTMEALSESFGLDTEEIRAYAEENPDNQYYVLKKSLSYSEMSAFTELMEAEDSNIKGIWFETEYSREYPYGSLAAALLGFTTSGNVGIGGIEDYYNETLNGIDGKTHGYIDSDSSYQEETEAATNGDTVVSTIDINIQSIVEENITDWASQYETAESDVDGAENIGCIVMDPDNGEILAMATYPTFDLNDPWNLDAYYTDEEQEEMSEDDELDALNDIWENFCITATYEPGSTTKPLTVATAIDSGAITGNESYVCGGSLQVSDYEIHCDETSGHGTLTIEEALAYSCNVSLMQIGFATGIDLFCEYQQTFNIGLKTNIDLPGEARTDSLIYTAEDMSYVDLATNSFGQSFNVTMIQVACAYSSLVNGGNYYLPHVVKEIEDEDGNTVEEIGSTLLRRTISESTSETMTDLLQAVTEYGTATTAKVDGYSMCGKTGTAEKIPRGEGNYVVSFICSIPAKDPEVVVYCVIDEPNVSDQAHSTYAQEIVHGILEEILPYMDIEMDEEVSEDTSSEDTEEYYDDDYYDDDYYDDDYYDEDYYE